MRKSRIPAIISAPKIQQIQPNWQFAMDKALRATPARLAVDLRSALTVTKVHPSRLINHLSYHTQALARATGTLPIHFRNKSLEDTVVYN
jgi:hypothetical protein